MKFDELTQSQVVMLALLVSFVSSVATGIITTSLLAQAPVEVTRSINNVVEKTVQTVASAPKEVSLRAEDQELLANVAFASQVLVKISEVGTTTPGVNGVIISSDGFVISGASGLSLDKSYYATLTDGSHVLLEVATSSSKSDLTVFKIKSPETAE